MLNITIVMEINGLIQEFYKGYDKYKIVSFLDDIETLKKTRSYILSVPYEFLSKEEACICALSHIE